MDIGIVRKIDEIGRIVIQKEALEINGMYPHMSLFYSIYKREYFQMVI